MVSEGIDDSSDAPTIWLIADRPNDVGPCSDGPFESGIRIFDNHDHPHRTTAKRLGAEVPVFRRLVSYPKLAFPHGQPSNHSSTTLVVDAEQFVSSECRLVELDRPRPVSNREHWGYSRILVLRAQRFVAHKKFFLSLTQYSPPDIMPYDSNVARRSTACISSPSRRVTFYSDPPWEWCAVVRS